MTELPAPEPETAARFTRTVTPGLPLACALPGTGIPRAGKLARRARRAGRASRTGPFFPAGRGLALTVPGESASLSQTLPGARS